MEFISPILEKKLRLILDLKTLNLEHKHFKINFKIRFQTAIYMAQLHIIQ